MTLEELKAENARLKAELAYDKRVQLHVDKLAAEFTQSEVERLKAEIERLTDCQSEADYLKAEVERLRKAGDVMAEALSLNDDVFDNQEKKEAQAAWIAAKEGKPSV